MKTFNLPDLGEGLPDAEIVEWLVAEGDEVKVDDPIVSMETAKAVVEVPSPYTGRIAKFYGQAGDVIKTGAPLVDFDTGEGDATASQREAVDTGASIAETKVEARVEAESEAVDEHATAIEPARNAPTPVPWSATSPPPTRSCARPTARSAASR
jgi:pyruvate dehydrogenase E2 component (dihydrolipoamide acetyltransferase)